MRPKRAASAPILDMTLERRIQLKRSVEDGELTMYDTTEKKTRTLEELVAHGSMEDLFMQTRLLGSGTYGRVHLLESDDGVQMGVAKIVGCISNLLGDPLNDPFRSEHVEPRILNFLWNEFVVKAKVTQHLMAPLGSHKVVRWTVPEHVAADAEMTMSTVHFMECATKSVLRYYFAPLTQAEFNLHFRVIFFQICYTFAAIQKRFPTFKHNDTKDNNVCMHTTERGGYYKYIFEDATFYVPRIGAVPILGDYDFACIPGYMFDNYKTLEQEWNTPTYNINTKPDGSQSDLWSLITHIRNEYPRSFTRSIKQELDRLFEDTQRKQKRENAFRIMPHQQSTTAKEVLLESSLFSEFKQTKPDDSVCDVFSANLVVPFKTGDPIDTMSSSYKFIRFCPLILSRNHIGGTTPLLPSQQYYLRGTPHSTEIDTEQPTLYVETEGARLICIMAPLYDNQFDFDSTLKEAFLDTVENVAALFLAEHKVPIRWWAAAFTCAWNDTAAEMLLFDPDETSWTTEDWVHWWSDFGGVSYSEMQLLHFFMQWTWLLQ